MVNTFIPMEDHMDYDNKSDRKVSKVKRGRKGSGGDREEGGGRRGGHECVPTFFFPGGGDGGGSSLRIVDKEGQQEGQQEGIWEENCSHKEQQKEGWRIENRGQA